MFDLKEFGLRNWKIKSEIIALSNRLSVLKKNFKGKRCEESLNKLYEDIKRLILSSRTLFPKIFEY